MSIAYRFATMLVVFSVMSTAAMTATAQQPAAKTKPGAKYLLRYKLRAGESLVSRVTHFADTQTVMAEHAEASSSRTTSEKVWEVKNVNDEGDMTFEYRINSVKLAQTVGENEELSYDSETDAEVPAMFKQVAETVNKPLATITINPQGQVLNRDKELKTPQLGIGELTIPLPSTPVAIDGQWSVPRELRVKSENGVYKKIKVRELYTLTKVSAGVATISIVTQPLTPITDPGIEAQLIQQLSRGEIKFDLDNGRLLSKRLDWKEEVIGFKGPETSLRYDAKFTEELLTNPTRTAAKRGSNSK